MHTTRIMGALASQPWHVLVCHPLLIDFGLKNLEKRGRTKLDGLLPHKGFQARSVPWPVTCDTRCWKSHARIF